MELEFTESPRAFLDAAGAHLAREPLLSTVVSSVTARAAAADAHGAEGAAHPRWWVTVCDTGRVVGAAMRTAPFPPYPAYVLPMPEPAARALARTVHGRGEVLGGVNGALPAARVVAEETAALTGGTVRVDEHLWLWEATEVVAHRATGRLRPATAADVALCTRWWNVFAFEAAEQSGRARPHGMQVASEDDLARRVEAGEVWLWESPAGEVVHLTACTVPAYGVSRVGPVYTPPEHRGHGYASAAVAQVSAQVLGAGTRACLFTDQANPTSNKIYAAVGYQRVAETANLLIA